MVLREKRWMMNMPAIGNIDYAKAISLLA